MTSQAPTIAQSPATNFGLSPSLAARLAGLMYVLLIPLGIMAMIYVPTNLLVAGDIAATMQNIKANEFIFRLASVSVFVTQLVNLVLVFLLYKLLAPVGKSAAISMVVFILLALPIAWITELNYAAVLQILDEPDPSSALVSMFLEMHEYGINIASIFWGLWLFPMGYLVFKSTFLPRIIGVLLMIGCFGYLIDAFAYFLNPNTSIALAQYLFVGEMAMAFWLLIMGVNDEKWHAEALNAQS